MCIAAQTASAPGCTPTAWLSNWTPTGSLGLILGIRDTPTSLPFLTSHSINTEVAWDTQVPGCHLEARGQKLTAVRGLPPAQ